MISAGDSGPPDISIADATSGSPSTDRPATPRDPASTTRSIGQKTGGATIPW